MQPQAMSSAECSHIWTEFLPKFLIFEMPEVFIRFADMDDLRRISKLGLEQKEHLANFTTSVLTRFSVSSLYPLYLYVK